MKNIRSAVLDQHRGQALGAEPLVDAKEVDLRHLDGLLQDLPVLAADPSTKRASLLVGPIQPKS